MEGFERRRQRKFFKNFLSVEKIKADEPDETRVKEAEENLSVLKEEVKKENPQWSTIKKVLEWALNFGRDVFIQILPILLEKYGK